MKGAIMANKKLIGNKSSGYNYSYTSLGDLVMEGVELPPMRIATLTDGNGDPVIIDGRPVEYIEMQREVGTVQEYGKIETSSEWVRGARVVIPSGTKMNEAQAYGSAITYARRYSALMLLGIACDDDNKIEVHSKEEAKAQELAQMEKELNELYKKAGGKAFTNWLSQVGGLTFESYPKLKADLLKRINDSREMESKE